MKFYRIGGLRSVVWPALALFFSTAALAQSANPFVPAQFEVPAKLETREFRLRMLTVNDVVKDYDAVMTSVAHLKTVWPGGTWPEARQSELAGGLEPRLYTAVQEWLAKEWPFKRVAFPGRSIDWDTWRNIPDENR